MMFWCPMFFLIFYDVFGFCFRTLAVILVSDFLLPGEQDHIQFSYHLVNKTTPASKHTKG